MAYVDPWPVAERLLALMPLADAMECTGLPRRAMIDIRMGRSDSTAGRQLRTITEAASWARKHLKAAGLPAFGLGDNEVIVPRPRCLL